MFQDTSLQHDAEIYGRFFTSLSVFMDHAFPTEDLEFLADLLKTWYDQDFEGAMGSAAVGVAAGLWGAHQVGNVDDREARADALLILVQRAAHLSTVDIHKLSEGIPGKAGFGRCYTRSRQSEKQMLRDVQSCLNAEPGEREIYAETISLVDLSPELRDSLARLLAVCSTLPYPEVIDSLTASMIEDRLDAPGGVSNRQLQLIRELDAWMTARADAEDATT